MRKRGRPDQSPRPAARATDAKITVPPEGIPILWVWATGREFADRHYRCPEGHYQTLAVETFEIGDTPVGCDRCAEQAAPWSASQVDEYTDASGKLYRGEAQLPVGAVYEHRRLDGEVHNWISGKRIVSRPNEQDGRVLCCKLPDGHSWTIDSRANNCTMPADDTHWCWVRSGRPEDGTLHVHKGGHTCKAGAGSIQTGRWHGFLDKGRLRERRS